MKSIMYVYWRNGNSVQNILVSIIVKILSIMLDLVSIMRTNVK